MKKITSKLLPLCLAVCLLLSVSVSATATTAADPITKMVIDAVVDYRSDYYNITDMSTRISGIEQVSGGTNVIIEVEYSTRIKADTPEDSLYVQGIEAAISNLTDEKDIEKATEYLDMWRSELTREHIGQDIPHHAEFCVFIPVTSNEAQPFDLDSVSNLNLENAQLMYRQPVFVVEADARSRTIGAGEVEAYEDVPMEAFELPSSSEVMQDAYNAVQSIVNSNEVRAQAEKAKELDREAAAKYAKDPNNFPYNDAYEYFGDDGGDCANFVSQCYFEGNVQEDDVWYKYSEAWNYAGGSRSEFYGIADYMQDVDVVFWVNGDTDMSRAFAGSIIYYQSGTPGAHVAIVTSNDGYTMKYSAHTTDHCDEEMSKTWFANNCDFLIPCWDSYDDVWTPQ